MFSPEGWNEDNWLELTRKALKITSVKLEACELSNSHALGYFEVEYGLLEEQLAKGVFVPEFWFVAQIVQNYEKWLEDVYNLDTISSLK